MNRKKFTKILNKNIKNKTLTNDFISDMFEKYNNPSLFNDEDLFSLFKNNYEKIINNTNADFRVITILKLYKYDEMKSFIECKMDYNFKVLTYYQIENLFDNCPMLIINCINKNYKELFKILDIYKLFFVFKYKEKFTKECLDELDKNLKIHKLEFAKILLFDKFLFNNDELNDLLELVTKLIDRLLTKQNLNYTDIEILPTGTYSNVIGIGNKVLKLGKKRKQYKIKYDNNILIPDVRVDLENLSSTPGTLEITDKVETNINITTEDLKKLYFKMRDNGVICGDLKKSNVGITLKENDILSKNLEALGFYNIHNIKNTKVGDLVLLDTDYLFSEDEIATFPSELSCDFEKMYQEKKK